MKKIQIHIIAKATYLPQESSVKDQRFLWSYEITIMNNGHEIVQLLNRYWKIIDIRGHVEEVRGPGVIGLQPLIKPGKTFIYTSFCQLPTPQGTMEGHYEFQTLEDVRFMAEIPKFVLTSPEAISAVYRSKLH